MTSGVMSDTFNTLLEMPRQEAGHTQIRPDKAFQYSIRDASASLGKVIVVSDRQYSFNTLLEMRPSSRGVGACGGYVYLSILY